MLANYFLLESFDDNLDKIKLTLLLLPYEYISHVLQLFIHACTINIATIYLPYTSNVEFCKGCVLPITYFCACLLTKYMYCFSNWNDLTTLFRLIFCLRAAYQQIFLVIFCTVNFLYKKKHLKEVHWVFKHLHCFELANTWFCAWRVC